MAGKKEWLATVLLLCFQSVFSQGMPIVNDCPIRPGTLCAKMNFGGADLRGMDLSNSQFSGSYMEGANLSRTNFTDANLTGTDFAMQICAKRG